LTVLLFIVYSLAEIAVIKNVKITCIRNEQTLDRALQSLQCNTCIAPAYGGNKL